MDGPTNNLSSHGFFTLVYFLRSPPGPLPSITARALSNCFKTGTHSLPASRLRFNAAFLQESVIALLNEQTSSLKAVSSAVMRLL